VAAWYRGCSTGGVMRTPLVVARLAALALLLGCDGVIGDPGVEIGGGGPGGPPPPPPGGCVGDACLTTEEVPVPMTRYPRLTHEQWSNTVMDLFRLDAPPGLAGEFFPDTELGEFDTDARRLTVTAGLWGDYQRAAETVAASVTAAGAMDAWLPAGLPADGAARRDDFITRFGLRAYRRPLSDAEVARLGALFDLGTTHFPSLDAFTAGVRLALEAMLQSPSFVYRVERSETEVDGLIVLDDWELASKLSYLIWDTMPDDALFDAAAAGVLTDPAELRAVAEGMFDHPRAHAKLERFHEQLFEMDLWTDTDHSVTDWRPELAPMMVEESRLFIDEVIGSGGSVRDLLTSNVAFVNEDLAALYGVSGVTGSEYQRVLLDEAGRGGLLTRLGFLTKYATLAEPDSIHRGVFINNRILCRNIQAPPSIPDNLMPSGDTNRERITSITGPGTCGESCHGGIINPIGFAFEAYDAIGRVRADDNGFPIDDSATYLTADGTPVSFDGALELADALAEIEAPHRCYSTRLLEFAYGREYDDGDSPLVYRAALGSREEGLAVRDILVELVESRSFRTRAVEELALDTEGM